MQKLWIHVLLLSLLQSCAPAPSITPAPDQVRSPWRGFAPGSWVVIGMSSIGHESAESMTLYRDEVVGTDPTGDPLFRSTLKPRTSEVFLPSGSTFFDIPRQDLTFGMLERSRRREPLNVGGKTLNCSVVEYTYEESSPAREGTLTVWKGDGVSLPPWDMVGLDGRRKLSADIVHATFSGRRGTLKTEVVLEVDDFHSTIEVGGRKVECVVGRIQSTTTYGTGHTILRSWRIWLSPEIPGGRRAPGASVHRVSKRSPARIHGPGRSHGVQRSPLSSAKTLRESVRHWTLIKFRFIVQSDLPPGRRGWTWGPTKIS